MCRERESADDLVQNTVLSALDKQSQFEAGTNLKGWLFTIMRNPLLFGPACPAGGGRPRSMTLKPCPWRQWTIPEASLALKELSAALWKLSPQSREV